MDTARKVTDDIFILPSHTPIPGFGLLPVNAYVIKSREPVLVDTGLREYSAAFMNELRAVIDPDDLKWLWLTHPDQDHVGSLRPLLDEVPHLRLVTTFLGLGILSLFETIPLERLYFVNPGESLDVGDRTLTAFRPPAFDNPATTGLYDSKSGALFSSDCFGGLLQRPVAAAEDLTAEERTAGQTLWATVDAPWLHKVDRALFASEIQAVRRMQPSMVLSSHMAPARGLTDAFVSTLAAVPDATPFVGPNQQALEAMLAGAAG